MYLLFQIFNISNICNRVFLGSYVRSILYSFVFFQFLLILWRRRAILQHCKNILIEYPSKKMDYRWTEPISVAAFQNDHPAPLRNWNRQLEATHFRHSGWSVPCSSGRCGFECVVSDWNVGCIRRWMHTIRCHFIFAVDNRERWSMKMRSFILFLESILSDCGFWFVIPSLLWIQFYEFPEMPQFTRPPSAQRASTMVAHSNLVLLHAFICEFRTCKHKIQ